MIRSASATDADAIAHVHARGWEETYSGVVPAGVIAAVNKRRPALWRGRTDWTGAYVAEDGDGVCGFGLAGPQRETFFVQPGEIWSLYVLDRAKGRGVGRALMEAMAAHLAAEGAAAFTLWVMGGNVRARGFYERLGGIPVAQKRLRRAEGWLLAETAYAWDGPLA